ncbi:hypothetical protein Tco_0616505 [Tanacetum coccineum]
MKVEESLNMTFDESPSPTKLSPLVDDGVGEEEAIENNIKVVNNNNNIKDESVEVDDVVNIKESKNHPLGQSPSTLSFNSVIETISIERNVKAVDNNNIEVDEVVNIKESKNHPLEQVIEPKNVNEALGDEN